MGSLNYRGPDDTSAPDTLGTKAYVDSVKATAITQAQVDSRITNQLSSYATLTYVDTQDGANATKAYIDQQDSLRLKLADKGVANGVATLDSSRKVPAAQLPPTTQRYTAQPWSPSAYNGGNVNVTSAETTLYTVRVNDPGFPYRIVAWGYSECNCTATGTSGVIYVRVGSTSGTAVSLGQGRTSTNYGDCVVMPYNAGPVITGATTLYFRGARYQGSGTVTFTNFKANTYVMAVPA